MWLLGFELRTSGRKPTKRDDYPRLVQLVRNVGKDCKNKEILKEDTIKKVLENMGKIYNEIRG